MKEQSNFVSATTKISMVDDVKSFRDSNLFLIELILRYPMLRPFRFFNLILFKISGALSPVSDSLSATSCGIIYSILGALR